MTTTEALLPLVQRQRRFEWALARDEQARTAARLVARKTHDLLNLVQIVQLASLELGRRCGDDSQEFIQDLSRAAADANLSLQALMELARPEQVVVRGPAVGATIRGVLDALRPALAIDAHLAIDADTATALSAVELEHLVLGLVLDAAVDAGDAPVIELYVRERAIDGRPWVEIVRGADAAPPGERFELGVVELLARRAGGELARSDRRGGGAELVVALPALPAPPRSG